MYIFSFVIFYYFHQFLFKFNRINNIKSSKNVYISTIKVSFCAQYSAEYQKAAKKKQSRTMKKCLLDYGKHVTFEKGFHSQSSVVSLLLFLSVFKQFYPADIKVIHICTYCLYDMKVYKMCTLRECTNVFSFC